MTYCIKKLNSKRWGVYQGSRLIDSFTSEAEAIAFKASLEKLEKEPAKRSSGPSFGM